MSSLVFRRAAFETFRDFRNESENNDWGNGIVYPNHPGNHGIHDDFDKREPPPFIVLVQGPPKVGKSLLIKSLVRYFIPQLIHVDIQGPFTIRTDKDRRIQFVECPDSISGMIDAAKYADLVLLMVDATFEFEAETFEFINLLQAHNCCSGVLGVLTRLDEFNDEKHLKETKKRLHDNFRTEINPLRIYNLSGLDRDNFDLYKLDEIKKLAEDISTMQMHPWAREKSRHPYVLVDRFEDITPPAEVQKDANCKRNIFLYGYLRGCYISSGAKVHIAGVGDFRLASVTSSADPLPAISFEVKEENDLVDASHMEIESFGTGTYLRLEVCDIPSGMVENYNRCHPILVGGISDEEENVGYMQARLKRHEWHRKLLESRDPITVSAGWRRYQTKPIYSTESGKLLKLTPEHNHCLVMFWGPLVPPLARIAVVQSSKEAFRVAAKAVILDPKSAVKIMKEIKQKGAPLEIFKRKTALIDFTEETEVSKYKGQPTQTLSGIRGIVKKATERKGIAKCVFKYGIGMSDIVFMRVWRQVEAPRFFNPAALGPCDSIVPVNKDSLNKDDPSQRRVELEQRRGVDIIDGEPLSYSHPSPLRVLYSFMNKNNRKNNRKNKKKKSVMISKEEQKANERRAKMSRRHQAEDKKAAEDEKAAEDDLPDMLLWE